MVLPATSSTSTTPTAQQTQQPEKERERERGPQFPKVEVEKDTFDVSAKSKGVKGTGDADKKLGTVMQKELDAAVKKNKGNGGGVMRISQGDKVLWEGTSGHTDKTKKTRMDKDTRFDIASVTKSFTAATTLQLAGEKKFDLDAPITKYLDKKVTDGIDPKTTVRQLLQHKSGLPHYWDDPPVDKNGDNAFSREFQKDPNRHWKPEELVDHAKKLTKIGKPGEKYHYSDTNYVLLGMMIEKAEGKPLHDVMKQRIFEPLGMKDTYFSHHGDDRKGKSQAHRFEGKLDLQGREHQSADWAGGGLVSNTKDLEKFTRALHDGKLIKDKDLLKQMRTMSPTGKEDVGYGLGLFGVDYGKRGKLIGHDGYGTAFAYHWPEKNITFTGTLNQTENDLWPLIEKAMKEISKRK